MTGLSIRRLRSASFLALALVAGCAGMPGTGDHSAGGLERWECGDFVDGCLFRCPVTLMANTNPGHSTGTVKFAGIVEAYECSFVISADGTGKNYDFRRAASDSDGVRSAKPLPVPAPPAAMRQTR